MAPKQVLSLAFGVLIGYTLSLMFFNPNEIFNSIFAEKSSEFRINENNKRANRLEAKELYNTSMADDLFNSVRVLCWILTTPENHKTKALHVKNTWGKRCNRLLLMSNQTDLDVGTIALPVQEGRETLWDKTRSAFHYVYNYHLHEAEWFLKADDDSYFVMENLRYVLAQYRPETSLYLGHRFASEYSEGGYMAGGGYVLSKKALEKFVTKLMHNSSICKIDDHGAEDLELGRCFRNRTIFVDERDELLQKRFFPVGVNEHLSEFVANSSYWYDKSLYYDTTYGGLECCSDTFVNSHYRTVKEMYTLDYYIYNVHPFGLQKNLTEQLPRKLSLDEVLQRSDVASNATNYKPYTVYHDLEDAEKFKRR